MILSDHDVTKLFYFAFQVVHSLPLFLSNFALQRCSFLGKILMVGGGGLSHACMVWDGCLSTGRRAFLEESR